MCHNKTIWTYNNFYYYLCIYWSCYCYLGVLTLLKYPYPRDIAEPATYEKVRVHAEWGKNRKSSVANSTEDSVQSVRWTVTLYLYITIITIITHWSEVVHLCSAFITNASKVLYNECHSSATQNNSTLLTNPNCEFINS